MSRLIYLFLIALVLTADAAPMTVKEIDFLLRQQTPETEILSQLGQRRLLAPPDPAGEKQLGEHGATPGLIATLKQGQFALSAAEAQAFALRMAPPKSAPALPAINVTPPAPPEVPAVTAMLDQLAGKLVHLEGDEVKPLDTQNLRNIRLFAIYNSAIWCGPCRKFTPKLVEAYQRLKAKHPDFEVIFVSSDRDENSMANYMRTDRMPFPAVRFGAQADLKKLYCGNSIPWLVCVAPNGQPLTKNGADKQYIAPDQILGSIESLLAELK
jgi:nucleoredoxin